MAANAGVSKPKNTLKESILGPMVTIKVGGSVLANGCKDFCVHENLICAHSQFFQKAYNGLFKEASTKIVELEDDSPRTFAKFVQWLYTGDFDIDIGRTLIGLFDVYVFAEKIQASRLKDETINKLLECQQSIRPVHIEAAFEKTPSLSPLRKWVIREVKRRANYLVRYGRTLEKYPELLLQVALMFARRCEDSQAYGLFPIPSNCLLHEHGKDGYCKWKEEKKLKV
ncbi:MAG: hypothetical protein M1820_009104 [Bogoriella megaspora]|nr:MAG: hypothetical protein M1820_009104 [Bogoriella megaspora]